MSTPAQPPRSRVADLLSAARLGPYLAAANGNQRDALRLYRWNLAVSGAAYEALSVFEVVLRNAMDEQLSVWNSSQMRQDGSGPCSADWLLDPSRLLERLSGKDIGKARSWCTTGGLPSPAHGDVLAKTSFGTWRYLLWRGDAGTQYLWRAALHAAFPHWSGTAGQLSAGVRRVHLLHNRVAHLEPMLNTAALTSRVRDMEQVLQAIDPSVESWFTGMQRVTGVVSRKPF